MKFEEVLPAWRSGSKIRRKGMCWWLEGKLCRDGDDEGDYTEGDVLVAHLLADDWEIVEEYEEVEVWDWVWDNPTIGLTGIETGLTEQEAEKIYFEADGSKLLGRIEESKRVEKRRKQ